MTLTAIGTNEIAGKRGDSVTSLPITDSTTLTAGDFLELSNGKLIKSVTSLSSNLVGVAASTITTKVYSETGQQDYMGTIVEGLVIVKGLVEGSGGTYTTALAIGSKVSFHYDSSTGYGQFVVNSSSAPVGTVISGVVASSGSATDYWDYVLVQLDFESVGPNAGGAINITSTNACAINVSAVQTDETGLTQAAVFKHGSYQTALAYGTQTAHLVLKSMNITAGATAVYVFGNVTRITTSATSTGYMNCSYDYLSVGHNLVNGWATRGRVALTATCEVGEMSGLLGTCEVTGTTAITVTGGAVLASAILDMDIATTATVAQEVTCLEVRPHIRANIAGSSSGIRINVNCSTANYLDYGLDIRSMSANQTGAMRVLFTGASASLPAAIILEGQASSTSVITSGIKMQGSTTYFADFGASVDAAPFTKNGTAKTGTCSGWISVLDQDGTIGYVNVYTN